MMYSQNILTLKTEAVSESKEQKINDEVYWSFTYSELATVLIASLHFWENITIGSFLMYANQKRFQFWFIKIIHNFIWMYLKKTAPLNIGTSK